MRTSFFETLARRDLRLAPSGCSSPRDAAVPKRRLYLPIQSPSAPRAAGPLRPRITGSEDVS
jgi:hypothetical protein